MFTPNTITVVTAATGHSNLVKCLESVEAQTFENVEHLVVVDGAEHEEAVRAAVERAVRNSGARSGKLARSHVDSLRTREVLVLPHATGKERWNGHRIYGAMSLLCNTELIAFLDEDNWYDPEHLESVISAMRAKGAAWGFSLRKLWDAEGKFLGKDQCESLGSLHSTFIDPADHLVDTSCYVLKRQLAAHVSPLWYRPASPPYGMTPADREICKTLLRYHPVAGVTRQYTLNYLVGNRAESSQPAMFEEGNRQMADRYPHGLPWEID